MSQTTGITVTYGGTESDPQSGMARVFQRLEAGYRAEIAEFPQFIKQYLQDVVQHLADKHGGKWPSTGPDTLSRRSGNLMTALQEGIRVSGATGSLAGNEYVAIQEFGGVITATTTQYLAVPLPAALDEAGVPLKDSPRDWENTFVQMTTAGNLVIFQKQGRADIVPLYVLKTRVTIPARLGAEKMAEERLPYFVDRIVDVMLAGIKL